MEIGDWPKRGFDFPVLPLFLSFNFLVETRERNLNLLGTAMIMVRIRDTHTLIQKRRKERVKETENHSNCYTYRQYIIYKSKDS